MLLRENDAKGMKACVKPDQKLCTGSDCNGWQWDKSVAEKAKMATANKGDFLGYCGLAGVPTSRFVMPRGI